jgi:hypothetical protein
MQSTLRPVEKQLISLMKIDEAEHVAVAFGDSWGKSPGALGQIAQSPRQPLLHLSRTT